MEETEGEEGQLHQEHRLQMQEELLQGEEQREEVEEEEVEEIH